MEKPTEICLAFIGQGGMIFDRLAWWLTEEGSAELARLQHDPAWAETVVVGYDADGNPLAILPDAQGQLAQALEEAGSAPLRLAEAEDLIDELLEAIDSQPMTYSDRWHRARVEMLRLVYDDRSKGWEARSDDLLAPA